MKERPILFSGAMVRALLAGTKTQTRRIVKFADADLVDADGWPLSDRSDDGAGDVRAGCPYGAPGDRLWVKETWQYSDWTEYGEPWIRYRADDQVRLCNTFPIEWDDRITDTWADLSSDENREIDGKSADRRWRPSIFMPRWASRITLEVTGVRVERLQSISPVDAMREGVEPSHTDSLKRVQWRMYPHRDGTPGEEVVTYCGRPYTSSPVESYKSLWLSINGPGSWDVNPWVWVIEFKRLDTVNRGEAT